MLHDKDGEVLVKDDVIKFARDIVARGHRFRLKLDGKIPRHHKAYLEYVKKSNFHEIGFVEDDCDIYFDYSYSLDEMHRVFNERLEVIREAIVSRYHKVNLPAPDVFENKYPNSRVLIISNGHSTKGILDKKHKLKEYFDTIIIVNSGFMYFDDIADFHIICEKISEHSSNRIWQELNAGDYRVDMPRIFNWKGIENYDSRFNIHKLRREYFGGKPNIRSYKKDGIEGLLIGPTNEQNFSLGSVTLSSMHFAAMLGASEIYLIGADMIFKDEYDHFYPDRAYRDIPVGTKKENDNNVVTVEFDGKQYQTTDYFRDSARCIDKLIVDIFSKELRVFDFSNGLIQEARAADITKFL